MVIELGRARDIVAEKRVNPGELRHQVRDGLFKVGAGEKPAAPRKVLIQAAHDVVQTAPVSSRVADSQVEKVAEKLAFIVIGDAALGTRVVRVFFKPGLPSGLDRALRLSRRPLLEIADFLGEVRVKVLTRDQARPQQRQLAVSARDTLGKPQLGGVVAVNVVHRLQSLRPDALHVPEMKEFVRGDGLDRFRMAAQPLA